MWLLGRDAHAPRVAWQLRPDQLARVVHRLHAPGAGELADHVQPTTVLLRLAGRLRLRGAPSTVRDLDAERRRLERDLDAQGGPAMGDAVRRQLADHEEGVVQEVLVEGPPGGRP